MMTLPKLIYRFTAIPTRTPANFLAGMDKVIIKYVCSCKGPRRGKTMLEKNKAALTLLNIKTYSRYYGTGVNTDTNRNQLEQRIQK